MMGFKTLSRFISEFEPPAYVLESIVRTASVYCLTAKTGHGKTAWLSMLALAVATGRADIMGHECQRGRVAYLAYENPDDLRMRLMIAAFHLGVDVDELLDGILVLDHREKPEQVLGLLRQAGEEPFSVVIVDTFAAAFDGRDMNDNVAAGEFLRRLRPLTSLPGRPTVLVATHPVKGATEDNLVPYGGGAILNECDGNLTLNRANGIVALHWSGKLRGMNFEPILYRFTPASSPEVVDAKGRQMENVILQPTSPEATTEFETAKADRSVAVLKAVRANPSGSQRDWAATAGIVPSAVNRALQKLRSERLVENTLNRWHITKKGEQALDREAA